MKGRKYGGIAVSDDAPAKVYAGENSNVVKEAKARKKGGRVDGEKVVGKKSAMRLDRPGRKKGGRVGADSNPLSSAANTADPKDFKNTDSGETGIKA